MDQLIQTLRNFGAAKMIITAALILGLGSGLHYLVNRASSPELALLYSNLDLADAGKIVSKVESMGLKAEIRGGGTEVYVPSSSVARLRMEMAEAGLPRGGSLGYEIFDRDESLGTSSFVQDINRLRALEGEIARSISSLSQVSSARVHLVLPRRELFSRERQEPSASIVLSLNGPGRLTNNRVQAVQHMVASAVPGLAPEKVSIVDDRGNLLARGDNNTDILSASNLEEMRIAYENRLSRIVEGLVEKHVGPGNVRAEVSASMNFDRIQEQTEDFNPDGQVVRSTQTVAEKEASTEPATGNANAEAELPGGAGGGAGNAGQSSSDRTEKTVNYEISKTIKNHTREVGSVQKISVAVMVDGSYAPATAAAEGGAQGTNEVAVPVYTPRSAEEIENIKTLVKNAIGFNEERGDTVEVINMKFAQIEPQGVVADSPSFFSFTQPDIVRLVEALIIGLMGLLTLLMVVKPVLIRILEGAPQKQIEALPQVDNTKKATGEQKAVDDQDLSAPEAANAANDSLPAVRENKAMDKMLSLQQVEGQVREESIKRISSLIEDQPSDAVNVVRDWMNESRIPR